MLVASKILLNYMSRYKEAVEFAGQAWNELEETADPGVRATVNYVYAVCCSRYSWSNLKIDTRIRTNMLAKRHI